MKAKDKAVHIIQTNSYLTLATVTKDNKPWNTPLWFCTDSSFSFYFVSPVNTVHVENIRRNKEGFITIFDSHAQEGDGIGVYSIVEITELNDEKSVNNGVSILYKNKGRTRSASEFLENSKRRIYKAKPLKVWINDAKEEKGLYLDFRIPIRLV